MDKASFTAGRAYAQVLMARNAWRDLSATVRDEESLWQAKALLQPFEFDVADALDKVQRQLQEQMKAND